MTAKKRMSLVAAQYAAKAREMTREGDLLIRVAAILDEEGAQKVFEALQRQGLIDSEGLLVESASEVDRLSKAISGSN